MKTTDNFQIVIFILVSNFCSIRMRLLSSHTLLPHRALLLQHDGLLDRSFLSLTCTAGTATGTASAAASASASAPAAPMASPGRSSGPRAPSWAPGPASAAPLFLHSFQIDPLEDRHHQVVLALGRSAFATSKSAPLDFFEGRQKFVSGLDQGDEVFGLEGGAGFGRGGRHLRGRSEFAVYNLSVQMTVEEWHFVCYCCFFYTMTIACLFHCWYPWRLWLVWQILHC